MKILLLFLTFLLTSSYSPVYPTWTMETLFADDEMPSPDLSPKEVIDIQLRALQHNNAQDQGIATTFNFASPANKAFTGPLDRFKNLLKNPVYGPMLNFSASRSSQVIVKDDQAQQIVVLKDKKGNEAAFLFKLSRQSQPPYKDCWMTDSVIRLEMDEKIKKI